MKFDTPKEERAITWKDHFSGMLEVNSLLNLGTTSSRIQNLKQLETEENFKISQLRVMSQYQNIRIKS
jgi:methylglyoxal synthase